MAVRRRRLDPDQILVTETYGELPFVSDDALRSAAVQGAEVLALAGGVLTIVVDRHPTDLEHEMVTVAAVMEWKDRTDARPQRERSVETPPAVAAEPKAENVIEDVTVVDPHPGITTTPPADGVGDGLDPSTLEEEDVESIPVGQR